MPRRALSGGRCWPPGVRQAEPDEPRGVVHARLRQEGHEGDVPSQGGGGQRGRDALPLPRLFRRASRRAAAQTRQRPRGPLRPRSSVLPHESRQSRRGRLEGGARRAHAGGGDGARRAAPRTVGGGGRTVPVPQPVVRVERVLPRHQHLRSGGPCPIGYGPKHGAHRTGVAWCAGCRSAAQMTAALSRPCSNAESRAARHVLPVSPFPSGVSETGQRERESTEMCSALKSRIMAPPTHGLHVLVARNPLNCSLSRLQAAASARFRVAKAASASPLKPASASTRCTRSRRARSKSLVAM
mmetsp:Transcript_1492/g.4023  ORF Transcript_1492/g.4023 Transcript_1492/m.4023 type:complete len:298 (+) Transcript_1492:453-1346(+)